MFEDSSAIQPFNFEGNRIRVVRGTDGEPWFIAADVCKALGYTNTSQTLKDNLDDDEVKDIGGVSEDTLVISGSSPKVINESGLYCLTVRSRSEKAKTFRDYSPA